MNNEGIEYHGHLLTSTEYEVIMELERQTGAVIPLKAQNHHVIMLNLSRKNLTALPENLGNLTGLEELDVYSNKISTLPASIGNLDSLKYLILTGNQLSYLPDEIGNLRSLRRLYLVANQLENLPNTVGSLTALEELFVGENKLTSLPETIGKLPALVKLDLGGNQIARVPASLCNLKALKELTLNGNPLTTLPDCIDSMQSLESLWVAGTHLSTLPAGFWKLHALRNLSLARNKFTSLPEEIEKLENLESLNLTKNQLECLPESINYLKSLKTIQLQDNRLKTLPNFANLQSLSELDLKNNGELQKSKKTIEILRILEERGCKIKLSTPLPPKSPSALDTGKKAREQRPKKVARAVHAHRPKVNRDIDTIPDDLRDLVLPCVLIGACFPSGIGRGDGHFCQYSPTGKHFWVLSLDEQSNQAHLSVFESEGIKQIAYILFPAELNPRDMDYDLDGERIFFDVRLPDESSRVAVLEIRTSILSFLPPEKKYTPLLSEHGLEAISIEAEHCRAFSSREGTWARVTRDLQFELRSRQGELLFTTPLGQFQPAYYYHQYIAFSPRRPLCAVVDPQELRLFQTRPPSLVTRVSLDLPLPQANPSLSTAFLPDGNRCAIFGTDEKGFRHFVALYDVSTGKLTQRDFFAQTLDSVALGTDASELDAENEALMSEVPCATIPYPISGPISCRLPQPFMVHPAAALTLRPSDLIRTLWLYRPNIADVGSEFILCDHFGVRLFRRQVP